MPFLVSHGRLEGGTSDTGRLVVVIRVLPGLLDHIPRLL